MIKKPSGLSLADFVRGNQEIINEKSKAVADYKAKVYASIAKEFSTENPLELVIILAEKYHEPFKINQTQGRKRKWTPEIEAMLAVFIELRLDQENPRSIDEDIEYLLSKTAWADFAKKGNKRQTFGNEAFRKRYDAGRKSIQFEIEMAKVNADRNAWAKRLKKLIYD